MTDYELYVALTFAALVWLRYCYLEATHLTRPRVRIDPHADAHGDVPGRPSHE
jgi:hypothetical protein